MAKIDPIPPWLSDDVSWNEDEAPAPARDPKTGHFLPGVSGYPKGRPKGSKNKRTLMGEQMENAGSDVQAVVIGKALAGDMTAAALVLNRVHPPLRAHAAKVEFELNPKLSVAEQATQIMVAVSKGQVDPDTGKMLMDCLSAYVGLRDVETFLEEMRRLRDAKTIPGRTSATVLIDSQLSNGEAHDHS